MARTIIDVHLIQQVPPSCINRDDTGSPKTAIYGGARRARVSSQAWKRATRTAFDGVLDTSELGVRTKRIVEMLADEITRISPENAEHAAAMSAKVFTTAGIKLATPKDKSLDEAKYLIFLSRRQIEKLAELAANAAAENDPDTAAFKIDKKTATKIIKENNSVDLALFGRMVADDADLNIDAACQVAHALSVHQVENEFDYYTAMDDFKQAQDEREDAGAGMIGTVEFASSTLYRFATIDVDALTATLGDSLASARAVAAFITAFSTSMPTGKINTFGNRTVPSAILVSMREDQPVSLVGAFETALKGTNGFVKESIKRLVAHHNDIADAYGTTPVASWAVGVGDDAAPLDAIATRMNLPALAEAVATAVSTRAEVQS